MAADPGFAKPEVDMLVIQKRQAEGDSEQVEEIVVAGQNDEHLEQHLPEMNPQNQEVISEGWQNNTCKQSRESEFLSTCK